MTEGTCTTTTQPTDSPKLGSVGVLVPNTQAKVQLFLQVFFLRNYLLPKKGLAQ